MAERRIVRGRVSKDATCGPGEVTNKKERNFHASNWLFAQTTHIDVAPEIFHVGLNL